MFWEGRINIRNNEHKGQPSMILDKTVRCVHTLLKDNHCLTITNITNMQWEMAAHFSHEASEATIVHALQQLKMWKVCTGFLDNLQKNIGKNHVRVALNFFTQYEDGNDLLEQIITGDRCSDYVEK